jgi:hypothetical protein
MTQPPDAPAPEPSQDVPTPNTCRYCKSDIKKGARVCIECHQWQTTPDWLMSQVGLGDVALYGSLILVIWSSFNLAILGEKARFKATFLGCSAYEAEVYVANTGTSRGILLSGTVAPKDAGGDPIDAVVSAVADSSPRPVLAPDAGEVVRIAVPASGRGDFDSWAGSQGCEVALEITAINRPDGSTTPITVENSCTCSDFRSS